LPARIATVISSVPTISPAGAQLPRIGAAAKTAWIDLYRVFRNLPRVWSVALAINVGLSVAALVLGGAARDSVGGWVVSLLIAVANSFFLTPYIIAVHRLILLDEVASSYVLRPNEPRFQKFFGWSLILWACELGLVAVFAVLSAFLLLVLGPRGGHVSALMILTAALIFLICWAMLRLSILFPAIAVDAAGANWRNVIADTRGYAWRIFFIVLLASLPLVAIAIALWLAIGHRPLVVIDEVVGLSWITLLVVIASRLYQRLGNRVNQPMAA
jgi:hypothetical protein